MNNTSIKNIAVVGAGPSGIIFAMKYKKLNPEAKIDIYEKENFPRHRIGESLLPGILTPMKDLDLIKPMEEMNFLIKRGAAYKWGKSSEWWSIDFDNENIHNKDIPYAWHIKRKDFDNMLKTEAEKLGINFFMNSNVEAKFSENNNVDHIMINSKIEKSYDYYIDSSGISKTILKNTGNPKLIEEDKRVAIYGYMKNLSTIDNQIGKEGISIASFDNGWVWHIPISDEVTSIGIVTTNDTASKYNTKEKFISQLNSMEEFRELITDDEIYDEDGKEILDSLYLVKNWSYSNGKTFGQNWLAIGDSAYFHDPILSQGVTLAIWSGFEAAIHLTENNIIGFYSTYKNIYVNMKKMTDYWYNNNQSLENWFAKSEEIIGDLNIENNIFEKEAFTYVTSGEILNGFFDTKDQAGGYSDLQRKVIYNNLKKND